jgi:hypothetical protein
MSLLSGRAYEGVLSPFSPEATRVYFLGYCVQLFVLSEVGFYFSASLGL